MTNLNFINIIMSILFIELALSCLVIFIGTQLLINSSIALSNKLKIPKLIVGVIIVSFATSLPEFFVTCQAALKGLSDFAIGNIIGSNISNLGLVLGLMAIISPLTLSKTELKWNYFPLIAFSIFFSIGIYTLYFFNSLYGLLSILFLFIFSVVIVNKGDKLIENEEYSESDFLLILGFQLKIKYTILFIFSLILGSITLWLGTDLLIDSSKKIATIFVVSDRVIAISLVAIGTSLPELFASIYSILKSEQKMAIGNILGSNIFNILAVLGFTSLITDISINKNLLADTLVMLGLTLLLIPLFYIKRKQLNNIISINRIGGVILFSFYVIYLVLLF